MAENDSCGQISTPLANLPNIHYNPLGDTGVLDSILTNFPKPDLENDFISGLASGILAPFSEILSVGDMEAACSSLRQLQPAAAADHGQLLPPLARNDSIIDLELDFPCFDGEVQQNMLQPTQYATLLGPTNYRSRLQGGVLPSLENEYIPRNLPSLAYAASTSSSGNVNNGYGLNILQQGIKYPLPVSSNIPEGSPRTGLPTNIGTDYLPCRPWNNNVYGHASTWKSRGGIANMARDEYDYESLKRKIEDGNPAEILKIIARTRNNLHKLMVDRFGNGVVQSLFKFCPESYVNDLLLSVLRKEDLFISVCLHDPGHRSVVRLLERLKTPQQKSSVASVISSHAVSLTSSFNGHNVLKHCYQNFSPQDNEAILHEIANNAVAIGRDKAGCCILQNTISYAEGEARKRLVAPLIENSELLSEDPYGNYVIQYLIELGGPEISAQVIEKLDRKFVELSTDKFGSNVVEKCLFYAESAAAGNIIVQIMESTNLFQLLTDQYGNYVVQKALETAQGPVCSLLVTAINRHRFSLECHPYGRRVAAAVRRVQKSRPLR